MRKNWNAIVKRGYRERSGCVRQREGAAEGGKEGKRRRVDVSKRRAREGKKREKEERRTLGGSERKRRSIEREKGMD